MKLIFSIVHIQPSLLVLLISCFWFYSIECAVFNISVNLAFLPSTRFGTIPLNLVRFLQVNEQALLSNIDPTQQHSFHVHYLPNNGTEFDASRVLRNSINEHNILGVIGDLTSDLTTIESAVGIASTTWMCSGSSALQTVISSQMLSTAILNRNPLGFSNPFFFHLGADYVVYEFAIFSLIQQFGWKNVSIIYSLALENIASPYISSLSFRNLNVTAPKTAYFQEGTHDFRQILDDIFATEQQIILLIAPTDSVFEILYKARERGMLSEQWVWLLVSDVFWNTHDRSADELATLNGVLQVRVKENSYNELYNQSVARFKAQYPDEWIPPTAFYYADCMTALATGLLRIVNATSATDLLNKSYFPNFDWIHNYFAIPFIGLSGNVIFDSDSSDPMSTWEVVNWYNGIGTVVFNGTETITTVTDGWFSMSQYTNVTWEQLNPIKFASGTSDVPTGLPVRTYLVPSLNSPTSLGLIVMNGIFIFIIALTWLLIFILRHRPIIRKFSFTFLSFVSVSCILILVSNVLSIGMPTSFSCQVSVWLFSIGFCLICATCVIKTVRLYRVYDNVILSAKKPTTMSIILKGLSMIVIQIIILIIWNFVSPLQVKHIITRYYTDDKCSNQGGDKVHPIMVINIVYNSILLFNMTLFSFKTRLLSANLNETAWIFYSTQSMIISGIAIAVFTFIDFREYSPVAFVLREFIIYYGVVFTYIAIVGRGAIAGSRRQKPKLEEDLTKSTYNGQKESAIDSNRLRQLQDAMQDDVLIGEFAVKKCDGLMSTWHNHFVVLHKTLRVLQLTPINSTLGSGIAWRLANVQVTQSELQLELCLQLTIKKNGIYLIQFLHQENLNKWQLALKDNGLLTIQK